MEITPILRPWEKRSTAFKNGGDPWYQGQQWKHIRSAHINGYTQVGTYSLSNRFCLHCYQQDGKHNAVHTVDHITPIKEGGSKEGPLQSLCKHHNAVKTARDGNRQRGKQTNTIQS